MRETTKLSGYMAEQNRGGWRGITDDARRIVFILGPVGAVGLAVWGGTYWGWWAYMWNIALPLRVAGVIAVTASGFVIWYGLLFTSHYYFKKPIRNPFVRRISDDDLLIPPQLKLSLRDHFDGNTYRIEILNNGRTDTFATQVSYVYPVSSSPGPVSLRWNDTDQETREIIKGHRQYLELLRVTQTKAPEQKPEGRFELDQFLLLTPKGDQPLSVNRAHPRIVFLRIDFKITSVATGVTNDYSAHVQAATDGHIAPLLNGVLEASLH